MTKNRIITLLGVGVMMLSLQACSLWKRDQIFNFWQKKEVILPVKDFNYNYQEPNRKILSPERVRSLRLKSPRLSHKSHAQNSDVRSRGYYSANGNFCRILDASGSEVVCAVAGRWQYSPSILANSVRQ